MGNNIINICGYKKILASDQRCIQCIFIQDEHLWKLVLLLLMFTFIELQRLEKAFVILLTLDLAYRWRAST